MEPSTSVGVSPDLYRAGQSSQKRSIGRNSSLQGLPIELIEAFRNKVPHPSPFLLDDLYGEGLGIEGFDSFLKTVALDPILREEMILALKLDEKTFYPEFYKTEKEKKDRLRFLPFVYGPRIRSLFLNFINTSLRLNSENIKKSLEQNFHWDVVVIGAGFHGSLFINRMKAERPDASILIIDKEALPSQHFNRGGRFFRMNNTLNEHDDGPSFQRDEKYNLPHTYGPVQVTDLTGHRWPAAKLIAEIGRISLFNSQSDCLLDTEITAINKLRDLYLMKTAEGKTISASKIVFATGLGKFKIPCDEEESKAILEKALLSPEASVDSKIMTVDQAFARTPKISPLSVWKTDEDLDLILVGFGNSALTFLEFLYSMAPDSAYQFESIQKKTAMKTAVIVGASITSVTPPEIQKKLRPRYSGVLSPIKEGQAKLYTGVLTKVRYLPNGSVEAFYNSAKDGEKSIIAKRLILGTGYEQQVEKLLNANGDFKVTKEDFKPVKVFVVDSKVPIPICKKLDDEEIYIIGPAAGRDIVDVDTNTNGVPLVEIGQAEAIPYTSILTEAFARNLAQSLKVSATVHKVIAPRMTIEASSIEHNAKASILHHHEKASLVADFITDTINEEIATAIKAEFVQLFSHIHFKNLDEVALRLFWEKDQLVIEANHFGDEDGQQLASKIRKNTSLLSHLAGYVSAQNILSLSIKIDRAKDMRHQLVIDSLKLDLAIRQVSLAYLNTSNTGKRAEFEKLYEIHDVKLFFAPAGEYAASGSVLDRVIAKAKSVDEGVLVEENSLDVEGIEVQDNEALLQASVGKKATWHCYLCKNIDGEIYVYRACVPGIIVDKRGEGGFGFDPYFQPEGTTKTLAEEKLEKYNARALAIEASMKNEVYKKIPNK